MGFWDATSFGNDDAADWVSLLTAEQVPAVEMVREALLVVVEVPPTIYLDAPRAAVAVAAAEVVAAASGTPGEPDDDSQAALEWARSHPEIAVLRPLALAAVERVNRDNSALPELWSEELADPGTWNNTIVDLRDRLTGHPRPDLPE